MRSIRRLNNATTLSTKGSKTAQPSRSARPSFSIILPTYQRRETAAAAVSALGQLQYHGDVELIAVVDGSTDGSAEALRAIHLPFPLTVIEQDNAGASAARNRGAALARNDILLFLDDDMVADPDLLTEHARLHRDGADAVIGETPVHPDSPRGFLPESVARWINSTRVQSPLSPFDIFTGQLSVRRSVFEALGGFDPGLTRDGAFGNEDADFGVKLLASHDVRHNPAALSRQLYVLTPRQYMDRARLAAAADAQFMRKHPQLARELLERKGYDQPLTRFIYRPLAHVPGFVALLSRMAVAFADAALKTPLRSNRLIAKFYSGARAIGYWSALRAKGWLPLSDSVLVLCYHAIEDQSDDPVLAPYGVAPDLFGKQLDSLTKRGFTFVSPNQFESFLQSGAPLPSRPVLLTFDDGYADLPETARTILQPRKIDALAFAVTGSATNEWDQPYGAKTKDLVTPTQRRELGGLGIEIGSHSRTHCEMPLLAGDELTTEASGSLEDLRAGGLNPRFFAYPYGTRNASSKKAVADAGYCAAFGTAHRRVRRSDDRFDLPRVMIHATDRGWRFRAKTAAPGFWGSMERIRRRFGAAARRMTP